MSQYKEICDEKKNPNECWSMIIQITKDALIMEFSKHNTCIMIYKQD